MGTAQQPGVSRLERLFRPLASWSILILLALITLFHYREGLEYPFSLDQVMPTFGFTRHALDRILYLAPIVWTGFLFGWKGAMIVSLVALASMLPRVIFISETPLDALAETIAVFFTGNVLAISFSTLRRERGYHKQLEMAQQGLLASEERFRSLFENAHDAIWVRDMEGNILDANQAAARLTGYPRGKLVQMKVTDFLPEEGLERYREVQQKILRGEAVGESYDQKIVRNDASEAFIQLSTSPVFSDGKIVALQHIARDITQEKRMRENSRFVFKQMAKAQEEERKRISRELHDDTIQSLIVLSRQLDTLASGKELSEENRLHLEELWQQTNNIIQGVRRLSQDLRPAALDRLGLLSALEWLTSDVAQYSGIAIKLNVFGSSRSLPEETELVLFRIVQEALRNVWRHSHAISAEITVEFEPEKTRITISDNGKGFSLPEMMGDLARKGKLGLAGMQERAQLLGGALTVKSEQGKGTTVTVEIPA